MFEVEVGQRQVNFSWSPPPVTQRNGIITSYTLSCSPSPSSLPQSPSQAGPLTVAGFSPDSFYSCSVVATNSQGSGPPANITFITLQDCKFNTRWCSVEVLSMLTSLYTDLYFQLRLGGVVACSELIVSVQFLPSLTVLCMEYFRSLQQSRSWKISLVQ